MDELARFRLDDKVAVVSGGTGSIGSRLGLALAGVGARVVIVGRSTGKSALLAKQIKGLGSEALLVNADVTKKVDADRAIDEAMAEVRPCRHHRECRRWRRGQCPLPSRGLPGKRVGPDR